MNEAPLPLAGIRVLDAATFIAAPFAAGILGEFGAEVIKVEQPGAGDPLRRFGTPTEREDSSLAWLSEGRNKKSITLDLKNPEGAELFKRLAGVSDVVCENFRPGTLEKWGLGWDVLHEVNPRLVMLRISGYGQTGPYRDRPGFARIAHAVGGLAALAGVPGEGAPVTPGSTSLGDYLSGLYGVVGILLALRHRDATGRGQYVDLGLYESVFRVLDEIAPVYARTGKVREREGAGTAAACPHGHFPTRDGQWVAIACSNDKMFARFAAAMDRLDLLEPYGDQEKRLAARETMDKIVSAWTGSRSRDRIMEKCFEHQVPCGPLNTIADIFNDPQFEARGNLETLIDEALGPIVVPAPIPKLSETPGRVVSLGPPLGQGMVETLKDLLGLTDEDISRLRGKKVI